MDETIRDRLVCGLRNETIQKRLLAERNLTLATAIEIAQGMEAVTKQTSELRAVAGQSQNHEIYSVPKSAAKPKQNVTAVVELAIYLHCHFKDQKCRCCGKFGHIAKVCNSQEATGEKQQRNYSSRPRQQQHSEQHSRHSYPQQTRYVDTETPCDATQGSSEWGIFTVQSTTQPSIKVSTMWK